MLLLFINIFCYPHRDLYGICFDIEVYIWESAGERGGPLSAIIFSYFAGTNYKDPTDLSPEIQYVISSLSLLHNQGLALL